MNVLPGVPQGDDPDATMRALAARMQPPGPNMGFQPSAQVVPIPNAPTMRAQPGPNNLRDQTVAWWVQNAGVPVHVAEGIADNIQRESSFRPDLVSPDTGGPSAGLYQAHLDRMTNLQEQPNWQDPNVQHAWALKQVTGGDQIATQHWNEIRNAKTREEANQLWKQYFERPAGSPGHEQEQALSSGHADLKRLGNQTQSLIDAIVKEGGRSEETWKRLGEAQTKMQEYQERALKLAENPPSATPTDSMQKLGGIATIVGILGGLLTKQPLAASLNAGGAAMEAYNQNDQITYKRELDQWKYHTGVLMKMADFEHEQYRDILADERAETGDRMNRIHAIASLLGNERMAAVAQIGDERAMRLHLDSEANAQRRFDFQMKKFDQAQVTAAEKEQPWRQFANSLDLQWEQEHPGETIPESVKQEHIKQGMREAPGGSSGGGLATSKSFDIVDDKGKVIRQVEARERKDRPGFIDSVTGEPIELKPGEHLKQITPTTSAGGRAGAQVLRQQIGGREVLSDLQNAVNLPVGTTIGPLGTVHPGVSVTGALTGDLVRTLTDQDAQFMQKSMAGLTRELSILMSPVYGGNYAAQQLDPLVPKSGETLGTVLFSLARIAQSADNALEAIQRSPVLSNEQKEYAEEMREMIGKAIPWSPKQAIDFAHKGQEQKESFGEFVAKNVTGEEKLPEGVPAGSKKVEGTKDGHPVYRAPDGSLYGPQ